MSTLRINIFSVGCADTLLINYIGNDNADHYIVLDSGENENNELLKSTLDKLPYVDLLILTHIDNDYTSGLSQIVDNKQIIQKEFIKDCWFNGLSTFKNASNTEGSPKQKDGGLVRSFLTEKLDITLLFILNAMRPIDLFGATLTVVSPDSESVAKMFYNWQKDETLDIEQSDYDKTIGQLARRKPPRFDADSIHRSSIAFLFEYQDFKMLFLADSHPTVVAASLRNMGYSDTHKLRLDYLKVAHHGSRYKTSEALLHLIDCQKFVFTADGKPESHLPNKETLARILTHFHHPDKPITLIFNHWSAELESIFDVDKNPFQNYNFTVNYPKLGQNAYIIEF